MAWLQNLAGHAENLLNKIDQNAATVLNDSNKTFNDDIGKEKLNINETEGPHQFSRSKPSSSSLNRLISRSPVEILSSLTDTVKDNDTLFATISEKQKPPDNGTTEEHNVFEKSLHSSPSSSSIHNSFIVNQEIDTLQAKIAQLEVDNHDITKQLLNMQHLYSELRNENANLQLQIERTNEQLTTAQQEKEQYVARAQRILQEKEKLIGLQEITSSGEAEQNILTNYNEELKKELDFQQTKVAELYEKNKSVTHELQSLKLQHQNIQNNLHKTIQNLEENLSKEKKNRLLAEEDCSQKTKTLSEKINEVLQLEEIIRSKTDELDRLRTALKQKSEVNFSEEYEDRIKSLTQTLMFKQQNLETITTERNALRFQLEKIESEHRREMAHLKNNQVKIINMQDVHEERITVPHFMRVSPHDKGVTRRVKQTYSTLDSISVRTGVFLRRYPVARVFVFTYIVILHMWVLLVLFWYVPSIR